jgi:hypothetical protein
LTGAVVRTGTLAGAVDWAGLVETPAHWLRHRIQLFMQADCAPPAAVHWLKVALQVWEQDAASAWPAGRTAQATAMTAAHT